MIFKYRVRRVREGKASEFLIYYRGDKRCSEEIKSTDAAIFYKYSMVRYINERNA